MKKMKNRIKELRLKHHLTLEQLGQVVGLKSNTISRYEHEKRNPNIKVLQRMADFFGVPITYLQGTTSYIRKYELWACGRCGKHFFATEEPKCCPYCGSAEWLDYRASKTISF